MILRDMRLDVVPSTVAGSKEKRPEPWSTLIFRGQGDKEKPSKENEEKNDKVEEKPTERGVLEVK